MTFAQRYSVRKIRNGGFYVHDASANAIVSAMFDSRTKAEWHQRWLIEDEKKPTTKKEWDGIVQGFIAQGDWLRSQLDLSGTPKAKATNKRLQAELVRNYKKTCFRLGLQGFGVIKPGVISVGWTKGPK